MFSFIFRNSQKHIQTHTTIFQKMAKQFSSVSNKKHFEDFICNSGNFNIILSVFLNNVLKRNPNFTEYIVDCPTTIVDCPRFCPWFCGNQLLPDSRSIFESSALFTLNTFVFTLFRYYFYYYVSIRNIYLCLYSQGHYSHDSDFHTKEKETLKAIRSAQKNITSAFKEVSQIFYKFTKHLPETFPKTNHRSFQSQAELDEKRKQIRILKDFIGNAERRQFDLIHWTMFTKTAIQKYCQINFVNSLQYFRSKSVEFKQFKLFAFAKYG